MALTPAFSDMNNNPWKMSLLFSALMEVVLALLFLLSVCISIMTSTTIRFFHLRPPCFCTEPYGVAGWNTRQQENPRKLLCDYHAKKHLFIQNKNRRLSVHNLCEDCMLLNCTSTEENSFNVERIDEHFSSLHAPFHVNNCRTCSFRRRSSVLPCSSDQERLEDNPELQSEVGSDYRSSTSFARYTSAPRCCCCEKLIREMQPEDDIVKGNFAKVYVEDFEGKSGEHFGNSSSSPETPNIPCYKTKQQQEVVEQNSCKDNAKKADKDQEAGNVVEEPTLEYNSSLSDCKFPGSYSGDELQPQIGHVECKLYSSVLPEEENDGKQNLLQKNSLNSKFCLIMLRDEEQEDEQLQNNNVDPELCSEILMENRETLGSIRSLTTRALASTAPQLQSDQKIEFDDIKELKDALYAEKEAYNAIILELEEERNASATAANETMAMISRLQEEKAAVQMESRQFKRMVEEKVAFDQEAIALLKDILCKREAEKFALEKEVELYRSRLFNRKFRKWRQQRWKVEEFQEHKDKEKQVRDWNGRFLLPEGMEDDGIINETLKLQGTFKNSSIIQDYHHAETSSLPGDVENLCSTTRQTCVPAEKGRFQEEAENVIDVSQYKLIPAHCWEMQKSMQDAAKSAPNVGGLGALPSSLSNLNEHGRTCIDMPVENSILCSRREDEEPFFIGRSSLESDKKFHLDSCNYIDELDNCITIEVECRAISNTECLSYQQALDDEEIATPIERFDVHNQQCELPSDLPAFKISHTKGQEELQPFDRHHTNLAANAIPVDMDARVRGGYDTKLSESFAMSPGKIWQHRELKDSDQRNVFYETNETSALTKEEMSDDGLDHDSLPSANEFITDCLGYDPRTASMIKRDHKKTALEEEVNLLHLRLQVLEDDRHIMKNLMESFSPDREMPFPDDVQLQLRQLHGSHGKLENLKRAVVPQEPTAFYECLLMESY